MPGMPDGTLADRDYVQSRLLALAEIADAIGHGACARETRGLAGRLKQRRFFVACVGQFKRGKSTLLNGLVGRSVLPVGVAPVTSVATILRYGPSDQERAVVRHQDGRTEPVPLSAIDGYVTERGNPQNQKGVAAVEVYLASGLLRGGLCLVDTPGIGSVFRGSTDTTRAFLPQIDAALIVLGTDPPISADEADLIATISANVPRLLFAINKVDRASDAEVEEAVAFTTRTLVDRLGIPPTRLFEVSAKERLTLDGPTRDWNPLVDAVRTLTAAADTIVTDAGRRGLARFTAQVSADIEAQQRALRAPLDETRTRLALIQRARDDAERAIRDLAPLFSAVEADLDRTFDSMRGAFLIHARFRVGAELWRTMLLTGDRDDRRRQAYTIARSVASDLIRKWLARAEVNADTLYRETVTRLVDLVNSSLTELSVTCGAPLAVEADLDAALSTRGHFYFTELLSITGRAPLRWLADHLMPRPWFDRKLRGEACAYADRLLATNSARVANDLRQRVRESRASLETQAERVLEEAVASAQHILTLAQARHRDGEEAVAATLDALDTWRSRVDRIASETATR